MQDAIVYIKQSLAAIFLLALVGTSSYAQNADIGLLRDINLHRNESIKQEMVGVTNSVYPFTIAAPVAELVAGYAAHDKTVIMYGWQTVAALAVNTIFSTGLKYTVNRTRPYITYPDINEYLRENDPSFPSGHTSYSFCTATSLSICFPRWYVMAPAYTWAALAGYSRLYLGEHYPTDVLAGAVIGCGSAWLAYKGNKWLQQRKHKKQPAGK